MEKGWRRGGKIEREKERGEERAIERKLCILVVEKLKEIVLSERQHGRM